MFDTASRSAMLDTRKVHQTQGRVTAEGNEMLQVEAEGLEVPPEESLEARRRTIEVKGLVAEVNRLVKPDAVIERGMAESLAKIVSHAVYFRHGTEEIMEWMERAREMTGKYPAVQGQHIRQLQKVQIVPNSPIRMAVIQHIEQDQENRTLTKILEDVTVILERMQRQSRKDLQCATLIRGTLRSRLHEMGRHLGMEVTYNGTKAVRSLKLFISYERAVAIVQAIGVAPHELGV